MPLIGLHGLPGSRVIMRVFDSAASDMNVHIIAVDRPGNGLSSPNRAATLETYPRDIAELCDQLGVDRFIVTGVSGGGPFSLSCACHFGSRVTVAGVVSGIGPLRTPGSLRAMMRINRMMFTLARFSPGLIGFLLPRLIGSSMAQMETHVQNGTSPSSAIDPETFATVVADQKVAISTGGAGVAFDMRILWRRWAIPLRDLRTKVLMWHGDADDLAPFFLAQHVAAQLQNVETIWYPGEDHTGPLIHHKREILQALLKAHAAA